jgi:hypothetical protein
MALRIKRGSLPAPVPSRLAIVPGATFSRSRMKACAASRSDANDGPISRSSVLSVSACFVASRAGSSAIHSFTMPAWAFRDADKADGDDWQDQWDFRDLPYGFVCPPKRFQHPVEFSVNTAAGYDHACSCCKHSILLVCWKSHAPPLVCRGSVATESFRKTRCVRTRRCARPPRMGPNPSCTAASGGRFCRGCGLCRLGSGSPPGSTGRSLHRVPAARQSG